MSKYLHFKNVLDGRKYGRQYFKLIGIKQCNTMSDLLQLKVALMSIEMNYYFGQNEHQIQFSHD